MGKSIKKEQIMMEDLKRNLLQGKYKEAEDICKSMDDNSIRDMIMTIAYDTENICLYCFIQYMIQRTGKVSWIELAIDIMLNPLCFIEGAYSVALFHARELLLIEKNLRNLERIIFFYNIPEKLVDEEEAKYISNEILKEQPDNEVALGVQISKFNYGYTLGFPTS